MCFNAVFLLLLRSLRENMETGEKTYLFFMSQAINQLEKSIKKCDLFLYLPIISRILFIVSLLIHLHLFFLLLQSIPMTKQNIFDKIVQNTLNTFDIIICFFFFSYNDYIDCSQFFNLFVVKLNGYMLKIQL